MKNSRSSTRKNGRVNQAIRLILILFFTAVFVFSLYKVLSTLFEYKKADDVYNDLRESFVSINTVSQESHRETEASVSEQDSEVPADDPAEAAPISVDFDSLLAYNSDIVGWLYCEGTEMNYPVVQTEDNDYYLRRDLKGNWLVTGTVFSDFRCVMPGLDKNYLIYGHDMNNDTIFGMLDNYASQEYYDKHPVYYFLTPSADYKIEVYTGVVISTSDEIYRIGSEGEDFTDYVKDLAALSEVTPNFEISEDDTLMTLSTCSNEHENARFVLIGKVIELNAENSHE